jgi:DNA-binding GntR family transcriptional regulator
LVSIEKIFKKDEAAVWKRNIDSYLKIDREFHLLFANLHNNHFMINAMENVRDLVDWSGFRVIQDLSGMLEIHQEHAILLKALRDRDPDAAEVAMLEHLKRGEDRTLKSSLTLRMN